MNLTKGVAIFIFYFVLFSVAASAACTDDVDVYVKVIDDSSNEPVQGVSVTLQTTSGTQNAGVTNSDGKTGSVALRGTTMFDIRVSFDGQVATFEDNEVGCSDVTESQTFEVHLNMVSSGTKYVLDEKLVSSMRGTDTCGVGYTTTFEFTDLANNVVKHCIKTQSGFNSGTYVVNSYIELSTGVPETLCSKGGEPDIWFQTTQGSYYLCVEKKFVSEFEPGSEKIMLDAVMGESCSATHNSQEGPVTVTDKNIYHCAQIFNGGATQPTAAGDCVIYSVSWVNFRKEPITEATGWEQGRDGTRVFLWAKLSEGCLSKKIIFNVYEAGNVAPATWVSLLTPPSPITAEIAWIDGVPIGYSEWHPPWTQKVTPGFTAGTPIIYGFKAKIDGTTSELASETLTVSRAPDLDCDTDNDCRSRGEDFVCAGGKCVVKCLSDAECDEGRCDLESGKCVECLSNSDCEGFSEDSVCEENVCTKYGNCVLSNPRWQSANGNILTKKSSVKGWTGEARQCGDPVDLVAFGTEGCQEKTIEFKIMEKNFLLADRFAGMVQVIKGKYFVLDWEPPWTLTTRIQELFELNSLEYYFVPVINGEEIKTAEFTSNILKVVKPNEVECMEDRDCNDNTKKCDECGMCVDKAEPCRFNRDCGENGTCVDGKCAVSADEEGCETYKATAGELNGRSGSQYCVDHEGELNHCGSIVCSDNSQDSVLCGVLEDSPDEQKGARGNEKSCNWKIEARAAVWNSGTEMEITCCAGEPESLQSDDSGSQTTTTPKPKKSFGSDLIALLGQIWGIFKGFCGKMF